MLSFDDIDPFYLFKPEAAVPGVEKSLPGDVRYVPLPCPDRGSLSEMVRDYHFLTLGPAICYADLHDGILSDFSHEVKVPLTVYRKTFLRELFTLPGIERSKYADLHLDRTLYAVIKPLGQKLVDFLNTVILSDREQKRYTRILHQQLWLSDPLSIETQREIQPRKIEVSAITCANNYGSLYFVPGPPQRAEYQLMRGPADPEVVRVADIVFSTVS